MGRFRLHLGRGTSPPAGSGGGSSGALSLGVNLPPSTWWTYVSGLTNIASAGNDNRLIGSMVGTTSGNPIPDANRDANGYVKSLPGGEAAINFIMQLPITTAQQRLTWDSKLGGANQGAATLTISNATGITYNLASRFVTFTPSNINGVLASGPPSVNFTPVSSTNYPVNWRCVEAVDPGTVVNGPFSTGIAAACTTIPIIRFMDENCVNRNNSPIWQGAIIDPTFQFPNLSFPVDGDGKLAEPIYTSANRNRNSADPTWHDGRPVEDILAMCTALGAEPWYCFPWNCDSTFLTAVAALFATWAAANPGKEVHVELSNEIWNFGFTAAHQCYNEAISLGLTGAQRYAQKAVAGFAYFEAAFASAGVSTQLDTVLAWHNYGSETVWDEMLNFTGVDAHVKSLAVAPYYGDNSEMGIPASYVGSTSALTSAISTDIDASIAHTVLHAQKANQRSKRLHGYEGGLTVNLSDYTYKLAYARSVDTYNLEMRFLQQLELRVASILSGGFRLQSYNFCYPIASSDNFQWGLIEAINQTRSKAVTPKLQSHVDFKAGTRVLAQAIGTLSIPQGAGASVAVGTLQRSVFGSTVSIVTSPANALRIVNVNSPILTIETTGSVAFNPGNVVSWTLTESYAGDPLSPAITNGNVTVSGNSTAYTIYEVYVTGTTDGENLGIAEIEMALTPGGADQTAGQTYSDSGHFNASTAADKAFDDNTGTDFASNTSAGTPKWVRVTFAVAKVINQLKITARSGSPAQAPINFVLRGSNNGTSWTNIISPPTQSVWTGGETRTFVAQERTV